MLYGRIRCQQMTTTDDTS